MRDCRSDNRALCAEQPCEPGGGRKLELYRQPWYPLEERYGLVFAYLGPPERRPLLPRYDVLEDLDEHLQVHPTSRTLQTGGPARAGEAGPRGKRGLPSVGGWTF